MSDKTITIVSLTSRNIPQHVNALNSTMSALKRPCRKILFCPGLLNVGNGIDQIDHPVFRDWSYPKSYNHFMLRCLFDFIDTDFVITVHDDGFGRNSDRWTDEFLAYDYIGAPWPSQWQCGGFHVGNGGFSLRSRQLIYLCKLSPDSDPLCPEDVHICRDHRSFFDQRKCVFAPVDVALRFSVEYGLTEFPNWSTRHSFGFHGRHNLHTAAKPAIGVGLQKTFFTS